MSENKNNKNDNKLSTSSVKDITLETLKKNAVSLIEKSNQNFYKLGDTLNTIKALMEHKSFSLWLNEEVDFSHNLANKYMKIASTLKEDDAVKFGVRKSYALSSLSKDQRDEFIKNNDVKSMPCSELEKKIRESKNLNCDSSNKNDNSKAESFIKNISKFSQDLSKKITAFTNYKDAANEKYSDLISEYKEVFDILEQLNLAIKDINENSKDAISNQQQRESEQLDSEQSDNIDELEAQSNDNIDDFNESFEFPY